MKQSKMKEKKGGFLGMFLGASLGASLLGNFLTGKGTIRAGKWEVLMPLRPLSEICYQNESKFNGVHFIQETIYLK